jgi:transcriptional regulator with XRE-family HTH domain
MDDFERLESKLLRDPEVRKALDVRRPAFELASQMIGIRVAAGLTQQELADRAGMTQPEIARLESGATVPGWETLSRVLAAVGAEVDVTLKDKDGAQIHMALPKVLDRPRSRRTVRPAAS